MMTDKCCRLCMLTSSGQSSNFLDIFSDIGVGMKMIEIIGEHFNCEVSEFDALPNVVCQKCWQTTDAFHQLYEKSKTVQEKFQNSLIKVGTDANDVDTHTSNNETHFIEVSEIEIGPVKIESNLGEEDSLIHDYHQMDFSNQLDDRDGKGDAENIRNYQHEITNVALDFDNITKSKTEKRQRRKNKTEMREENFSKLFAENKHLFDLNCDSCATVFETLDEARNHYANEHNIPGYIKCCSIKLTYPCHVVTHLKKHYESRCFQCTECSKGFWKKYDLQRHMKIHTRPDRKSKTREKTVQCPICEKLFTTQQMMRRHMEFHQEEEKSDQAKFISEHFDLKCDYCDVIATDFYDACRHYKESHGQSGYIKCCKIKFRDGLSIMDHVKSHLDPESFKCDSCNKTFATKFKLGLHKRRHEMKIQKKFICDYCGKRCTNKNILVNHLYNNHVTSEPRFECEICHKKFQLKILLKHHMYTVHREKKYDVTCEKCGKAFSSECHLQKHMQTHMEYHERDSVECTECFKKYLTKSHLKKHMESHTHPQGPVPREKAVQCPICEKLFTTQQMMRRHMEFHQEERDQAKFISKHFDLKCDYCDVIATDLYDARRHYKDTHGQNGYIKCCNTKFRDGLSIMDHIKSHFDPESFKCDSCNKTFATRIKLAHHRRAHRLKIQKKFICDFCGKRCSNKNILVQHLYNNHVTSEPRFECEICHKKYHLRSLLKRHMYLVHDKKKFNHTCETCGKAFVLNCHLQKHLLTHMDKSERLATAKKCVHCGDWMLTTSGVYYHEQKHKGSTVKCPHCQVEVRNRLALGTHLRHNHREHKIKCSYCDRMFPTASLRKKHEESHTRHNVYSCQFCSRQFTLSSSRLTHHKRAHGEELKRYRETREMMKNSVMPIG